MSGSELFIKIYSFTAGIVIIVLSLVFHEIAHGWAALKCGDTTAKDAGRLTFNPLKHIDLFGSVLFPVFLSLIGAPVFGWAKPVPIDPWRTRNPWRSLWITAIAGPLSNFVLALGCAFLSAALQVLNKVPSVSSNETVSLVFLYAVLFLTACTSINLYLMVFNLVPLPPLDGSKVVAAALPKSLAAPYLRLERYGFIILFFLLKFNLIQGFLGHVAEAMERGVWRLVGIL